MTDDFFSSSCPKVCVPIVSSDESSILKMVNTIQNHSVDMIEWRMDTFQTSGSIDSYIQMAEKIHRLCALPILATFRTLKEGGQQDMEPSTLEELYSALCQKKIVDLIDVEYFQMADRLFSLIQTAHESGIQVLCSHHRFDKTPSTESMFKILQEMKDKKADIVKLAVMPQNQQDVLKLISASQQFHTQYPNCPMVTISMGKKGILSRIAAEFFGSCMTFGALGSVSAPGQIDADTLYSLIKTLHTFTEGTSS